jgi:mannosyltransferase PIG-V
MRRLPPEWSYALKWGAVAWLSSRVGMVIATYFAVLLPKQDTAMLSPNPIDTFVQAWMKWDAGWYVEIASKGYARIASTAFFPLYPALTHGLYTVVPFLSPLVAALIISNLALLVALVLLVRLADREFGDHPGRRAAFLLVAYPGAFFFTSAYPEGLLLALMLASFMAARARRWLPAGAAAAAATLTAAPGAILGFPLLIEYLRTLPRSAAGLRSRGFRWEDLRALGMLAMIPLALGAFGLYLRAITGNGLQIITAQHDYFQREFGFLWGIRLGLSRLYHLPLSSFAGARNLLDVVPIFLAAVVLVLAIRLLPLSYSVFVAILLVLNLSEPRMDTRLSPGQNLWPLQSDLRQVLVMFPLFMALGVWAGRWPSLQSVLVYSWLPLQGILVLQYLHGFWII